MTADEGPQPSMRAGAARGAKWSFIGLAGQQAVRFLVLLVIARLIGPEDFGVVAQAMVFLTFIALFLDQGLAASIIQRKALEPRIHGTIFWLNAGSIVVLAALTYLCAGLVADFFDTDELVEVLHWLALVVVVQGLGVIPRALLTRRMRFKQLAQAELLSALAGGLVGVALAVGGAGYWALIVQTLVTEALRAAMMIAATGRPEVRGSVASLREILPFSLRILGFSLVNYGSRNLDNVLVGRVLGATPLAFYSLSYRTLMVPVQALGQVANRVALPLYSRMQDEPERVGKAYLLNTQAVALASFPLMVLVIVEAPLAVPIVFGDAWRPAIVPMQILAITGLRQSIQSSLGAVLVAFGRADLTLRWGVCTSIVYVASFVIGLEWGIEGVAAAYTLAGLLVSPFAVELPRRLTHFTWAQYLRSITPASVASVALAAVGLAVGEAVVAVGGPPVAALVVSSLAAVAAYVAVLRLRWPEEIEIAKQIVRDAKG